MYIKNAYYIINFKEEIKKLSTSFINFLSFTSNFKPFPFFLRHS